MTRAAFLGTPASAIPALAALSEIAEVALVVTQPDAPAGRSGRPAPPPVKVAAAEWGLKVAQPRSSAEIEASLRGVDLDVGVVVAYGRLLSPGALSTTRTGFVNVHFSLLPRWRGAAPVAHAILAGDGVTGVSLMVLDEGLDTGPVMAVNETEIEATETTGTLTARLSTMGARLLDSTLLAYLAGSRTPAPQFERGSTAAPRLTTGQAGLNPLGDRELTLRKIRAYNPKPGSWITIGGERLKVWTAYESDESVRAGNIVVETGTGTPVVGFADGAVALAEVQPAGKLSMTGGAWWRGRKVDHPTVDPPAA
jgi:methionyl-tRNA formyltransferase